MEDIIHCRRALPFIAIDFKTRLDALGNRLEITKVLSTEDGSFVTFTEDFHAFLRERKDLSMSEKVTMVARKQHIRISRRDFRSMLKFKGLI